MRAQGQSCSATSTGWCLSPCPTVTPSPTLIHPRIGSRGGQHALNAGAGSDQSQGRVWDRPKASHLGPGGLKSDDPFHAHPARVSCPIDPYPPSNAGCVTVSMPAVGPGVWGKLRRVMVSILCWRNCPQDASLPRRPQRNPWMHHACLWDGFCPISCRRHKKRRRGSSRPVRPFVSRDRAFCRPAIRWLRDV